MFLHDDDTVRPELLERKVELIEKDKDISMVGCGWNIINDNEEVLETRIYNKFNGPVVLSDRDFFFYHFDDLNFPWSGVLYNKEKIGKLRFEDKFDIGADYPFVARLAIGNKIGSKAYRAFGNACKSNPIPLIVPCHRVLKKNGELGGFMGKTDKEWETNLKKELLKLEGVDL